MKKRLFITIVFSLCGFIYAEKYSASFPKENNYDDSCRIVNFETDEEGKIISISYDGENKNIIEYDGFLCKKYEKYLQRINIHKDEKLEVIYNNRKYVYENTIMYVYFHNVDGIPNDTLIESKYTYSKENEKYIIKKYVSGLSEEGYNFYSFECEYRINGLIQSSNNEIINKQNFFILSSLNKALIPMLFSSFSLDVEFKSYSASSELREGKVLYKADNLKHIDGLPWIPAEKHNCKLYIETNVRDDLVLAIYSGYQSKEKPYLFKQNARPKKLLIKNTLTEHSQEVFLEDITERQIIYWKDLFEDEGEIVKLEISILEEYPGTKYNDICIQSIVPET